MESVGDLMRRLMLNPLEETDFLELQSATAPARGEQCPENDQPQGQRDLPVISEDVTEFIQSKKKKKPLLRTRSRCTKCRNVA